MNNVTSYAYDKSYGWGDAWQDRLFRVKLIVVSLLFLAQLLLLPSFFAIIEKRDGMVLNDWILEYLPAHDFSVLIFILIWSVFLLAIIRSVQEPSIFLPLLTCTVMLLMLRITTIYLFPLNPPDGLIVLKDPLTSLTYGGRGLFITKDLFFSGHTSNLFMVYLCLPKKRDKWFVLTCAIAVGALVLVQHVHYSMDVVGAFIITFLLVKGVRKFFAV
ncbi:MAG: phosphatase PAP2-related protein [Ferruginibacter sp.]